MQQAARQHGVITRSQVGPAHTSADWFVSRGLLCRVGTSVFVVSGTPSTPLQRAWVATLAGRGVLRGQAAAAAWGMSPDWPDEIGIYLPRGRSRCRLQGVATVRRDLPAAATTEVDGLPVTTRTVTALDVIGELPLTRALPFADRALQQDWLTTQAIDRRLQVRTRGNTRLRQVRRVIGGDRAEFEAERKAHQLLREADLTGWQAQHEVWVGGRRFVLDLAFPAVRLAVEIDGFSYHSASGRFQQDRTRQNLLVAAGWTVLRFSWQDLVDRPQTVIDTVTRFL